MIPGQSQQFFEAAAAQSGAVASEIERSLRFNSADSAYLDRTPSSAGNRRTWTWSCWVKRSGIGSESWLLTANTASNFNNGFNFLFTTSDTLYSRATSSSSNEFQFETNAVFRDPSAWYHIVFYFDSTQSTASNRFKLYVNNTEQTFSSSTYPSLNTELVSLNNTYPHYIGSLPYASLYSNVYLADVHFIDGQALTPSSFTKVDADTGQLIPIEYTGTYGTNGFHLPFSDNSTAAALGTDTSGNGNDWTVHNISVALTGTNYTSGTTFTTDAINTNSLFDGNDTTGTNFGGLSGGSSPGGTTRTFSFTNLPSVTSLLRLKVYNGASSSGTVKVNSGTPVSVSYNYPSGAYYTISGFTGSITSITWTYGGGNLDQAALLGIEVDGVLLADFIASNNDSLVDSPTNITTDTDTGAGGEVRGNYATLNPLNTGGSLIALSNGNLDFTCTGSGRGNSTFSMRPGDGKFYSEMTCTSTAQYNHPGIYADSISVTSDSNRIVYRQDGNVYIDSSLAATIASFTSGDVIGMAFDADTQQLTYYKNGSSVGGPYQASTPPNGGGYYYHVLAGNVSGCSGSFNFGQRPFAYTAPSGYKALCTTNLTDPTIAEGSTAMDVVTYTGDGATSTAGTVARTITGLQYNPDLIWVKERSATGSWADNNLTDSVRGTGLALVSNSNAAETNVATSYTQGGIGQGTSNGFSIISGTSGGTNNVNNSSSTYVAWTWDAGTTTATNNNGSIQSTVRANQSAGFSIVSYTGPGSSATIGHGLNAAPEFIIVKNRDYTDPWAVYHVVTGANKLVYLDASAPSSVTGYWGSGPTSSVFGIGNYGGVARSSDEFIAYCFAPVAGYSAFGSYTGNGSTDGPFVYTGFRPRFLLWKPIAGSTDWVLVDSARSTYNVLDKYLLPNTSGAEGTLTLLDFCSNGFKLRTSTTGNNSSGTDVLWAAFAEHPFKTARAR